MLPILILTISIAAPQPTYEQAYNKALKENKRLFVWRGMRDDYIVNKYKSDIHLFDPDLSKVNNTFAKKGVIVAGPYKKDQLKIEIETSQIGELAEKLISPMPKTQSEPLTKKRIIQNGLFYDLYSNGQMIPCASCNQGR